MIGKKYNIYKKIRKYVPPPALICYCFFFLGMLVLLLSICSRGFADIWNRYPAAFSRSLFSYLTYPLPVSFAEFIVLCLPVLLFLLFRYAIRTASLTKRHTVRYIISLFSALAFVFGTLTVNFSSGYYAPGLDEKLGLAVAPSEASKLRELGEYLLKSSNELAESLNVGEKGSYMGYDTDVLSKKLNASYDALRQQYDFIPYMHSRVKPLLLSEPMTYTHIAGVYTFFSGEANLNVNFPDYTLPFSAAHEMAHQRGFAREEEANFIAFLCCINSDDDYIKYSGYLNLYEYVASALYDTDREAYFDMITDMSYSVRRELIAYGDFFEKYEENVAADVTGAVNDVYLKSQGQSEGSRSYGLVVDLAIAYYQNIISL